MGTKAHCIIMAGGSGTRFWPASRKHRPKQLLKLIGKNSLLMMSLERALKTFSQDEIYISSGEGLRNEIKKELSKFKRLNYVFEPKGRNTAPCIGYMAMKIANDHNPNDVLVIMPADHLIGKEHEFKKTIEAGIKICKKENVLITIGIKPDGPNTAYGYIKKGKKTNSHNSINTYQVMAFKEKPDIATAKRFIKSGDHLWNSGIFIVQAGYILNAIKKNMPELYKGLKDISKSFGTKKESKTFRSKFPKLPADSIDYGVIEKLQGSMVIPADLAWNDLGDWNSLATALTLVDPRTVIKIGSKENITYSYDNKKLIALLGVENLIIADTPDALLIADRKRSQEIKKIVEMIEKNGLGKHT